MSDLISRQKAIEEIYQLLKELLNKKNSALFKDGVRDGYARAIGRIRTMPSAQPRKGKWLKAYGDHEAFGVRPFYYYCSECNKLTFFPYDFCPNCGCRMEEGDSE